MKKLLYEKVIVMKKLLAFVLSFLLAAGALPLTAGAATVKSGKCGDNLTWTLDDAGTLTVSGTGIMTEYGYWNIPVPWKNAGVKALVVEPGVTSIDSAAFRGCKSLKSAALPGSLYEIEWGTFSGCTALESVVLGEGITQIGDSAFYGCTALKELTIPDSVKTIGPEAFYLCEGLKSLTVPDSVTSIGHWAFSCCYGLESAALGTGVAHVGNELFSGCKNLTRVTVPEGVESIGDYAFINCGSLAEVTIPSSVTAIGSGAFSGCLSLTEVVLPAGVTEIGGGAFAGCAGLTGIEIPGGVTKIGSKAFYGCAGLTEITVPNRRTEIGESAFVGCEKLETAAISAASVGASAFQDCAALKTLTLRAGEVGENAFRGCARLEDLTLKEGLKTVGADAFRADKYLKTVSVPPGTEEIGAGAFEECYQLESVTLPGSVVRIGDGAVREKTVIRGAEDSYARQWALENGRPFEAVCGEGHSWDKGVLTKEAAGGADGEKRLTCILCGATKTEAVPAAEEHSWTVAEDYPPICTENGEKVSVCEICGVKKIEVTPTAGHAFGEWTSLNNYQHGRVCANDPSHEEKADHTWDGGSVTSAPTCTRSGVRTYVCTVCGATRLENVKALGHNYGEWTKLDETRHQRVCANDPSHVQTGGHNFDFEDDYTPPTCTEKGELKYTCTVCRAALTEPIDATGHSYGKWTKLDETRHQRVCENDKTHVETADHAWDGGKVTPASCAKDGKTTYTCSVCGATKTEVIKAVGHKPVAVAAVAATCTADGLTEGSRCSVCGEVLKKQVTVKAPGHRWDGGETVKQPGCVTAGEKIFTCAVCGEKRSETLPAAGGHTFGGWTVAEPAGEGRPGKISRTCAACGFTEYDTLAPLEPATPTDATPTDGEPLQPGHTGDERKTGDVNGDGKVGSDDARLALRASVGLEKIQPGSPEFLAADANGNGKIGPDDARLILRASVGLERLG